MGGFEKRCLGCGEVRPLAEFHLAGKGRRDPRCKPCANELRKLRKLARMDIHEFGDIYQDAMKKIRRTHEENGD